MKKFALVALALVACSSSSNGTTTTTQPGTDAGTVAEAGTYEDAINAASWAVVPGAPSVSGGQKQDDIYFLDAMHGFAVSGPASAIYKTDDGGGTWSTVKTQSGTYFRSILFLDQNHGFASNLGVVSGSGITDTNVLYETKNGGTDWSNVTSISGTMPSGICNQTMIDATHLVAVGRVTGPSYMLTSSDAGASWTSIDLTSKLSMLIDAHFFSPTEGIVVGGSTGAMKCTILRTTDGGQNFTPVFTSKTANSLCWKITFPTTSVGYVSVQDAQGGTGTFAKTTDGGQTWSEMPLVAKSYPAIGMGFITENIGWVSADSATAPTYKTIDGGQTWTEDPVLKSPINRFRFVDKNTAYAIGGSIYKMTIDY